MWQAPETAFGPIPPNPHLQPMLFTGGTEAKRRTKNLLDVSGMTERLVPIKPRQATDAEILRVHTPGFVERLKALAASGGGQAGTRFGNTPIGKGGFEIAALAAGGVIAAVDAVLDGTVNNAYALVHRPGHHAEPDDAMGFCLLANPAIAARHALEARGLDRVAVVDWDVHHGNGTQKAFYDDPHALTISIHEDGSFPPNSGAVRDIGEGAGKGYNINIPLPPGSGIAAYRAAFERVILPALETYLPELIIVPCGLDAGAHDPLGRMLLNSSDFRILAELICDAAERLCQGRLTMTQEGGYADHCVPFYCLAVIEVMTGHATEVSDPYVLGHTSVHSQTLYSHQEDVIRMAEQLAQLCAPHRG
jgi:acetoin utilization deacetylase AcuC-like enzyme